jgi:hypothetical protein
MDECPWWYYSQLSETTRAALAVKDPALLQCLCGGVVTAAKISASGADDGPAYLYCDTCYRADLEGHRVQHIPLAENTRSIEIFDIVWH